MEDGRRAVRQARGSASSELVDEYGAKLPDPVEKIVDATFEPAKNTRAQVRELCFGESKAKATAA